MSLNKNECKSYYNVHIKVIIFASIIRLIHKQKANRCPCLKCPRKHLNPILKGENNTPGLIAPASW